MTSTEPPREAGLRDRLLCALLAFLVVLAVGGTGATILVTGFTARVEEAARRDARLIGDTVARSLSTQFEKAARYGIPLKLLPGVESYLSETLKQTPGITRIVVRGPDGREVRSAIGPHTGTDTVVAPISIDGISFGQVDVTTTPVTLSGVLTSLEWRTAVAVGISAALAALAAGLYAGGSLARARAALMRAMSASLVAAGHEPSIPTVGRGAVRAAVQALVAGERLVNARRAAFDGYAEELLAVDFDGRLRLDIARIRREVAAKPSEPSQMREP